MGFLFWIFVAVLGYSIQSVLLIKYSRRHSGQWVGFIRNGSLILTGLPLLYFGELPEITYFDEHRPLIVLGAVCGATNIFLSFVSSTFVPVGIGATLRKGSSLIASFLLGILLLNESITFYQAVSLIFIVLGGFGISFLKVDTSHLKEQNLTKGFLMAIGSGIIQSIGWYFFVLYSAGVDPLISAYILEASIGCCMLLRGILQFSRGVYTFKEFRHKDTLMISLVSILSYVGTIAYATALGLGGLGLSSGMMVLMIPASILIAWFLFRERLTLRQLLCIGIVLIGVVVYKVYG